MGAYRKIICATRGGMASKITEERAIEIAKATNAKLTFIHVVNTDLDFLKSSTGKLVLNTVQDDLRECGRLILSMAQNRAKKAGINAKSEIREGIISEQIKEFLRKRKDINLLVMGCTTEEGKSSIGKARELAEKIRGDFGIDVLLIEN